MKKIEELTQKRMAYIGFFIFIKNKEGRKIHEL